MKNNRIWIIPNNDLEAKAIIEMLEREGEEYLITGQALGASWDNLEEEIKEKIVEARKKGITIYGVELQGKEEGTINIDHHIYGDDDRSNPKSSLEQVSEVLGVELSIDERFISANDKGYIPEMERLGRELGISEEDLQEIISNIRMRDRQMQGVTTEQEEQAEEAVNDLGEITERRRYISIELPHSKTSTVTDRLYGKYDNLLITSVDGETNFFGSARIITRLNERFPGGQLDTENGFWRGNADQEEIKEAVESMIEEEIAKEEKREKMKEFWLGKYQQDKVGTVARVSQAMQHGAWLREWQRVHGNAPRIKPITEKVNGEKVKVGEADIAVPWSRLPEFFRKGNEYGDVETAKFLRERIESGDTSDLSEKELHDLSERENVKWSNGVHSINPFQGYLYDFTKKNSYLLEVATDDDYGRFYPISDYVTGERCRRNNGDYPDDIDYAKELEEMTEEERREYLAEIAFSRVYTTKLVKKFINESPKGKKFADFADFDITSVTTWEQIYELDEKLTEITQSDEFQEFIEEKSKTPEYERAFYEELRREVEIEIKKDSDRIENAHRVYIALETGDIDSLLEDPETLRWLEEEYDRELREKQEQEVDS